jgi:cell division septal protein FtsQ
MTQKKLLDLRDRPPRFRASRANVTSRREKPTPLRARRRRARLAIAGVVLVVLVLIAGGITALSHAPSLSIASVNVVGARDVPVPDIQKYVNSILDDSTWHYFSSRNIFSYKRRVIETGLMSNYPRILTAVVSRPSRFSRELTVSIEERRPSALWCAQSGQCYLMDDSGFIFAPATTATVSSYSFDGGISASSSPIGQTFAGGHMPSILSLLERLRESDFSAGGVTVNSDYDLIAHLIKGYDLKIAIDEEASMTVRNLKLVLTSDSLKQGESKLAYIDLRFGNRVYFKMKPEDVSGHAGE